MTGYCSAVTECPAPNCKGPGHVGQSCCFDGFVSVAVNVLAPNPLGLWGQAPANRTRPALWASVVLPGDRVLWAESQARAEVVRTGLGPTGKFYAVVDDGDIEIDALTQELILVCHPDMRPDLPAELRGPKEIVR